MSLQFHTLAKEGKMKYKGKDSKLHNSITLINKYGN